MKKYLTVFKISWQEELVYRTNFIVWRIRNITQIFLIFFLWDTVFSDPSKVAFGYNRARILTYVFGIIIIKAFVFSAKTLDVAGEISRGDLTNYLLKPINYFKYWLTRDLSSKALNLVFAILEFIVLYLLLKPTFFFQTNLVFLLGFLVSLILAIFLFFLILFITSFIPFWVPELAWGAQFLVIAIIAQFLSGALFPIDILPSSIQGILLATPFPYLIFFPLQVYLGKISGLGLVKGLAISFFWLVVLWFLMNQIWRLGLKAYRAEGR